MTMWRVESDGIPHHTRIYDGEGNLVPLDGVVTIQWEIGPTGFGQLTLVAEAALEATAAVDDQRQAS